MVDRHELAGYVNTAVPIDSLGGPMEFSTFFGACAVLTRGRPSNDRDQEDAFFVTMAYERNIREPIVGIICEFLKKQPPQAHNLISGEGGTPMTILTKVLMDMMDNAFLAHVKDLAAFEGPSPVNFSALRMAGYLWLTNLRGPGKSWKPLTHWFFK